MIFRRKPFERPTTSTEEERVAVEVAENARRLLAWGFSKLIGTPVSLGGTKGKLS